MDRKDLQLAVLIDAENIPSKKINLMMEEITKYGNPTFKRIYADWTKPNVSSWKKTLLENAITPIQQYSYSKGKNASDSALIIDAMDILYSGKVDGFCIVSSDSDYTRLAVRLRESGMFVIGMGEEKTLQAFTKACDKFIYIEILGEADEDKDEVDIVEVDSKPMKTEKNKAVKPAPVRKVTKRLVNVLRNSIADLADDEGWVFLGDLGNLILKKMSDFDSRNYGFPKLLSLLESIDDFEFDKRQTGNKNAKLIYVRNRPY